MIRRSSDVLLRLVIDGVQSAVRMGHRVLMLVDVNEAVYDELEMWGSFEEDLEADEDEDDDPSEDSDAI